MASKDELVKELGEMLPLDEESLVQIVDNALKLPSIGAINEYWLGLLGESPAALEFMTKFNSQGATEKAVEKPKHSQTPPRREQRPKQQVAANVWSPNVSAPGNAQKTQPRLTNKASSTTTSQLLDKKPASRGKTNARKEKERKVDNLKDLEAVLNQLETESSKDMYSACGCMATRHPLFEVVPNCLNCGKIICVKEGLRPCSFCGKELISADEKAKIIQLLESERSQLETSETGMKHNGGDKKKKPTVTLHSGAGVNLWKQQDALFKKLDEQKAQRDLEQKRKVEEAQQVKQQDKELQFYAHQRDMDEDLMKAKSNLENLLNFQANSAERTRIIDQASDYELPTGSNLNMWSSSVEKALQLKKQQRQLRKQEKRENELKGRGKKVMNITIGKDGKATMREVQSTEVIDSEDEEEQEQIDQLEKEIAKTKASKAEDDFKTVWDFQKDQDKWEKPVYVGHGEPAAMDNFEIPSNKWGRVQSTVDNNNDEEIDQLVTVI